MEEYKETGAVQNREDQTLAASKEKLKRDVDNLITSLFDTILDVAEVAIGDPQRYKPFRSKVLRSGNDTIRQFKKIVDNNYKVLYVPSKEDVVKVSQPTLKPKSRAGER